jgi:hypothetical protein
MIGLGSVSPRSLFPEGGTMCKARMYVTFACKCGGTHTVPWLKRGSLVYCNRLRRKVRVPKDAKIEKESLRARALIGGLSPKQQLGPRVPACHVHHHHPRQSAVAG